MSPAPESFGNFDLIKQVKLKFTDVTISKWQSRVTGLSIVHLDYEGMSFSYSFATTAKPFTAPIVSGYFVVATESQFTLSSIAFALTIAHSLQ